ELLHDHIQQLLGVGQPFRRGVDRRQPYGGKRQCAVVLEDGGSLTRYRIARGTAQPAVAPVQPPEVLRSLRRSDQPVGPTEDHSCLDERIHQQSIPGGNDLVVPPWTGALIARASQPFSHLSQSELITIGQQLQ